MACYFVNKHYEVFRLLRCFRFIGIFVENFPSREQSERPSTVKRSVRLPFLEISTKIFNKQFIPNT